MKKLVIVLVLAALGGCGTLQTTQRACGISTSPSGPCK